MYIYITIYIMEGFTSLVIDSLQYHHHSSDVTLQVSGFPDLSGLRLRDFGWSRPAQNHPTFLSPNGHGAMVQLLAAVG